MPAYRTRSPSGLLAQISTAHFSSHVHIMTLPALVPLLPGAMGVNFVELGIAISVFNVVSALVQAPLGFAVDRVGARPVLLAGLAVGSASFLLVALSPTFVMLLLAMAGAGLANGVYHPCDYALLSQGMDRTRMGRAFSIHTFSGFMGAAVTPLVLVWAATTLGAGWAFAMSGGLGLVVLAVLALFLVPPVAQGGDKAGHSADRAVHRSRASSAGTLAVLTLFFILIALSVGGVEKFSVSAFVEGFGIPLGPANLALSAFLFSSAFGVLAGGVLADRTNRHGVVAAGAFALAAVLVVAIILVDLPHWALIGVMGSAGFLTGLIAPSRDMLVRAAAPAGQEGRYFGIVSTGFNIGGVIGPVLFGYLLDQGRAADVLWASAAFMALTIVIVLAQEASMRRRAVSARAAEA